jgi:hypothetical protein
VFEDDLTLRVEPAALDRDGGGAAVDFGEQAKRIQHPAALGADLLVLLVLVGNVEGEALGRHRSARAQGLCQVDRRVRG